MKQLSIIAGFTCLIFFPGASYPGCSVESENSPPTPEVERKKAGISGETPREKNMQVISNSMLSEALLNLDQESTDVYRNRMPIIRPNAEDDCKIQWIMPGADITYTMKVKKLEIAPETPSENASPESEGTPEDREEQLH